MKTFLRDILVAFGEAVIVLVFLIIAAVALFTLGGCASVHYVPPEAQHHTQARQVAGASGGMHHGH